MAIAEIFTPIERVRRYGLLDHGGHFGEARRGQRQRAIVLARFQISESERDWQYPDLDDLVPVTYKDRYYPAGHAHLAWQAGQSLDRFVKSLRAGRKQAVNIAKEAVEEVGCEDLTSNEVIDVVTRQISFERFAIRIGLHTENDY